MHCVAVQLVHGGEFESLVSLIFIPLIQASEFGTVTLYPPSHVHTQEESPVRRRELSRTFLLTWKFFTSKIVRELTLMSAPSFGKLAIYLI